MYVVKKKRRPKVKIDYVIHKSNGDEWWIDLFVLNCKTVNMEIVNGWSTRASALRALKRLAKRLNVELGREIG